MIQHEQHLPDDQLAEVSGELLLVCARHGEAFFHEPALQSLLRCGLNQKQSKTSNLSLMVWLLVTTLKYPTVC